MARGVKRTIEQKIEVKKEEVSRAEIRVKTLRAELKELELEKQQALSLELAKVAEESGMSLEEAIQKLRQ